MHVLIIEDDRFNRRLYEDLLTAEGLEVHTVPTAAAGLARLHDVRPALVVMDIELPDADGLDVTERLKADPKTRDIPVLVVSAHALSEHELRARQVADAFLRKPLRFPEFQDTVKRLVGGGG